MYNDKFNVKYNVSDEVDDESDDLIAENGWCHNFDTKISAALESVASYDPRPFGHERELSEKKFWIL